MVGMVAKSRAVLFAVAVLTLARSAYAQNIDITIQGDPWKPSPLEARKQYLRGREADEMIRKGYVCYREVGSSECSWAKPERDSTPRARWGKCKQSPSPPKGRVCERITPYSSGGSSYYDFERPLVSLEEEISVARRLAESDNGTGELPDLLALFLKKAQATYKRLTVEQTAVLDAHFGKALDRAFQELAPGKWVDEMVDVGGRDVPSHKHLVKRFRREIDPNRWTAAHAKGAAEAEKAKSVDSAVKPVPIPDATPVPMKAKPAAEEEPAAFPFAP